LSRQFEDEKQRFFSEVRPVLAQIMTERGAVVIIDKRAVFVGFDNVDVTAAAIAALDASLGDGSAAAPATP
jgi:Skp family chaperone for outer membrane proteins